MVMAAEAEVGRQRGTGESPSVLRAGPLSEAGALWHELKAHSPETTLYHRESWIQLLSRAYNLPLWLASLHQGEQVVAGCVFAHTAWSRRFAALCFSDSCPPLARQPEDAERLMRALIAQAPPRRAYEVRGIGGVEGWETVDCFVNWQLNLDRPLARIESDLAVNFRRSLRRASRQAITIERGSGVELLRRFYTMQLESRRRLGLPPQPWRFFRLAREIYGAQGNFEVWLAREGGADVASAVFLRDGDVIYYKWGARGADYRSHANHLLFWSAIAEFSRNAETMDLGRADVRNHGLMRFKAELGAVATALPVSFFPHAPRQVSAEVLTGSRALLARIWRRMPIFATRLGGATLYRFLG